MTKKNNKKNTKTTKQTKHECMWTQDDPPKSKWITELKVKPTAPVQMSAMLYVLQFFFFLIKKKIYI